MRRRPLFLTVLLAGLAASAARGQTKIVAQKLAEGVWAAPTPGGANVAWFVLGDGVIAVDSGPNAEVGRALVEEIQKTTGKMPRDLVITHAHRDHAGGAAAFAAAGAQIIVAEKSAPGLLALLEEKARGSSPAEKVPAPKPAASPLVLTVAERSLLLGNGPRRAEVYYLGPAHTQGDLVVVLPTDGVLIPGDLAVNGVLPFLRSPDVDPRGWERILTRLASLKVDKMIPGHGTIGPRDGISDTFAYVHRVNEIATKFVLSRVPESMYELELRAPENTIEHVSLTPDHVANVKAVCQFEKAKREEGAGAAAPSPGPTTTPHAP